MNEIENAPDKTRLVGFEDIKTADAAGLMKMQERKICDYYPPILAAVN